MGHCFVYIEIVQLYTSFRCTHFFLFPIFAWLSNPRARLGRPSRKRNLFTPLFYFSTKVDSSRFFSSSSFLPIPLKEREKKKTSSQHKWDFFFNCQASGELKPRSFSSSWWMESSRIGLSETQSQALIILDSFYACTAPQYCTSVGIITFPKLPLKYFC